MTKHVLSVLQMRLLINYFLRPVAQYTWHVVATSFGVSIPRNMTHMLDIWIQSFDKAMEPVD